MAGAIKLLSAINAIFVQPNSKFSFAPHVCIHGPPRPCSHPRPMIIMVVRATTLQNSRATVAVMGL